VSILLGNGNGTFGAKVEYPTGALPFGVAIGDFNADAKLDLVTTNETANTVSILLGNGNGTFGAKVDYPTGIEPWSVAAGDFRGNGRNDLVVANYTGATASVLLNNGNGTFAAKVDYATGSGAASVAVGDVDGDGALDLAVANYDVDKVSVLTGKGDGTFAVKVDFVTGDGPVWLAMGDFNADGKRDLAVVDLIDMKVSVLLNTTPMPPAITSANSATFILGAGGAFTITATGTPIATLAKTGALPTGVTFTDNANRTATLAGTPTTAGIYTLTITAHNTAAPDATQIFTLTVRGPLTISTPSAGVNLGTGTPSSAISVQLGTVRVVDDRYDTASSWTATVTAANFTTGGAAPETIPTSAMSYWSGPATVTTGTGTFTSGQGTAANAQLLTVPRTAFTLTAGTLNNTASWNPSLVVTVPAVVVAGTYTATITFSVL
jgi:hypothetical protein